MTEFYTTAQGRKLAYHQSAGALPGVVFLGGFRSDMQGSKATALEAWAKAQGRAFLRFDYSGHGESEGVFEEGAISDWAEDAMDIIGALTEGPQLLVGSSMGGWISLLIARKTPEKLAGLVTVAAAPDFTEDSMWEGFSAAARAHLLEEGQVSMPSDYGDPYVITRRLIEDGRANLVLRSPLPLNVPARFLQGTEDSAVERAVALRLFDHVGGDDVQLRLVRGADHSFSTQECLDIIIASIEDVLARI